MIGEEFAKSIFFVDWAQISQSITFTPREYLESIAKRQ